MTPRQLQKFLKPLTNSTTKQLIKQLCGEYINNGICRDVYVLKQDPRYVVKVEYWAWLHSQDSRFANVLECANWAENKYWGWFAKWLAPCIWISNNGCVLVQVRADFNRPRKDYPKRIPKLFVDRKLENFGWIGNQLVAVDYPTLRKVIYAGTYYPKPMQAAKWWGSLKNI